MKMNIVIPREATLVREAVPGYDVRALVSRVVLCD
jgi:hypothetical protein